MGCVLCGNRGSFAKALLAMASYFVVLRQRKSFFGPRRVLACTGVNGNPCFLESLARRGDCTFASTLRTMDLLRSSSNSGRLKVSSVCIRQLRREPRQRLGARVELPAVPPVL